MDLIASFNAHKIQTSFFLTVDGILKEGVLYFLFDTGAVCSLIGLNSLFPDDETARKDAFTRIIKDELVAQHVSSRPESLRTANNQEVTTYPCLKRGVSIEGTAKRDFYFDFSFDEVSLPLLGTSFSDDCAYSHAINGNINITGIKEQAGAEYYKGLNILEFDDIAIKFQKDRLS